MVFIKKYLIIIESLKMPPKTTIGLPTSLPKIPRRPLTVTTTHASGGPMRTVTPRSSRFDPLFDVEARKLRKIQKKNR